MKRLSLFVFVDALGWKLAQEKRFLAELLPHRNECETLFGYSSTCDPTILTGCEPSEHGHFSCFVKARDKSPFAMLKMLSWIPHKIAGHHRVRNTFSRFFAKRLGYTGYFQLYSVPFGALPYLDYTEKKDIYEDGGIIGGQSNIFRHWKESGRAWKRSDWRDGDTYNIREIEKAVGEGEISLGYLFTSNLDAVMHKYGTDHPAVDQAFASLAERLTTIHGIASKNYDEVSLYVFSDHGMANTEHASDMLLRFGKIGFEYGRDYVAAWDSTMARFWFQTEFARKKISAWLSEQPEGRCVGDDELREWNCFFEDKRYGELFYLLPPGTIFAPSFMNQGWVTGMHGYEPSHPECSACWLTNREGTNVRRLSDIFGVMKEACYG